MDSDTVVPLPSDSLGLFTDLRWFSSTLTHTTVLLSFVFTLIMKHDSGGLPTGKMVFSGLVDSEIVVLTMPNDSVVIHKLELLYVLRKRCYLTY